MSFLQWLRALEVLISKGWCRNWPAQNHNNFPCTAISEDAKAWCLYGAAAKLDRDHQTFHQHRFATLVKEATGMGVETWNDKVCTSSKQATTLIKEMINALRPAFAG